MKKIRLFLASSSELLDERKEFELFINRKNKEWHDKGIFIDLIIWEDFLDAMSRTRLQDEYNKVIAESDLFVMLFFTKVGKYTNEEFDFAYDHFMKTNNPLIFTYFKDAPITTGSANKEDIKSLWAFQEKLDKLGHFYSTYKNIDGLKYQFNGQLDKLAEKGFIGLNEPGETPKQPVKQIINKSSVTGNNNIVIQGNNNSNIKIQNANKINNIGHIDNANFS